MDHWRRAAHSALLIAALLGLAGNPSLGHTANDAKPGETVAARQAGDTTVTPTDCVAVLGSNCDATQVDFLAALLRDIDLYGLTRTPGLPGVPALSALPKDRFGIVNWTKAVAEGMIKPKDDIYGADSTRAFVRAGLVASKDELAGFGGLDSEHFQRLIVMQVKNYFMADVLFPHGMHTYWVGCASCHPKPFIPRVGANDITFKAIAAGEYCGKCHGKVAFPLAPFENCRRCHVISKKVIREDLKR